jgi:GNAT superfamily N-acetyltransferase
MASHPFRNKYLKLACWRLLEPFFNVQEIFIYDLASAGQLSSLTRDLPQGIVIEILLGPCGSDLERVFALLAQARMPRRIAEERLRRGDMLAVATANNEIAAYTWTTFSTAWIAEARRFLLLRDDQAAQFDTVVMPSWRGKGLQYGLTRAVLQYLSEIGYKQTLAWVNARNVRSIRNQLAQGKRRIAAIESCPVLGLARVRRLSNEADFTIERRTTPASMSP